jgi:CheY-like chemotaxis protein
VLEARSGIEALRAAEQAPDLVLLDMRLPDISGHEVCARLKANPKTSAIVVLQTSAADITGIDRTQGLEAGADGYLAQPYEERELLAWINALLRARRLLAASNDRLMGLQQVTAALCDAATSEEVNTVILREGLEALRAAAGGWALLTEDGQHVQLMSSRGYFRGSHSELQPHAAERSDAPLPRHAAWRAHLPGDTFGHHDRDFMLTLARQCGQAIDRAQLYSKARPHPLARGAAGHRGA